MFSPYTNSMKCPKCQYENKPEALYCGLCYESLNKSSIEGSQTTSVQNDLLESRESTSWAREYQEKLALVFIDLDYFKQVNDQFGHQTGDLLLIKLAEYMRQLAKEGDIIARLAGDEFVMILPRYETKDAIKNVLDKLLAYLARPHLLGVNTIQSSCSIGVAFFPTDAHTPKHLKECADQAMYEAKRKGRAQYYFYTEYE